MEQTAAADGLEYHLGDGVTGNTLDAHRLLHLAAERGRQDAALERFYRAYFTEGRSLFDDASLTALAVEAGLDERDVQRRAGRRRLRGRGGRRHPRSAGARANGVPFFVFDHRFGVSGAQAERRFLAGARACA
jgi:predicted DsbA family dithiol-disulfide isomerase